MTTQDRRTHKRVVVYRAEVPHEEELYEVEYESVADAIHFACRDLRTERRRPLQILEDGEVVYDAAAIAEECDRLGNGEDLLERLAEENG